MAASRQRNSGELHDNTNNRSLVSPLPPSLPSLSPFQELSHFGDLARYDTGEKICNGSLFVAASFPSTEGLPCDHSDVSRPGSYYRASSSSISPASLVITPVTSRAPSHHDPVDKGVTQKPTLQSLIHSSLVVCTRPINPARADYNPEGNVERFVPEDAFERLICSELVRSDRPEFTQKQLDGIFRNRRRLFAILTMIKHAELITKLEDEQIDDSCLPFWINRSGILEYRSRTSNTAEAPFLPVHCLNDQANGNIGLLYLFCQFQWHFLTPNLDIDCPCDGYLDSTTAGHRRFLKEQRIPFVKITAASKFCDPERSRHGVAKAYIHPAHRRPCRHFPPHEPEPCHCPHAAHQGPCEHQQIGASCCAGPFAVKIISYIRGGEAVNEMDALRRFDHSGEQHRHRIVRLLCSFEYDSDYYLIFPHADANLWQFWKDQYPRRTNPPRGPGLTRWVAGEILGLVRGLRLIHNPPAAPDNDKQRGQLNGRHGDLKPENILWFQNEHDDFLSSEPTDDKDCMPVTGILKICDFDTTVIHSDYTVSHNNDSRYLVKTDAYSAPESAIDGSISQEYDSWSLGCILLQFVTWYALGWEGVKALEAAIRQDARRSPVQVLGCPVPMARFFDIDASSGVKKAYLIPAVEQQIGMLHKLLARDHEQQYNSFFSGVLRKIEFHLLKTDPTERALTGELVDDFHKLYRKCLPPVSSNMPDEVATPIRQRKPHIILDMPDSSPALVQGHKSSSQRSKEAWHRRILLFFRRVAAIFQPRAKA